MREHLTNVGKKEQRQINQVLNKGLHEGPKAGTDEDPQGLAQATKLPPGEQGIEGKDVEARTVPKQHRLKGRGSK